MRVGPPQPIRALVCDAFGDWRNVRVGEIASRAPGPDEVLIEAHATSINFPDLLMIEGKYQVRPPLPFVPGRDVAGFVRAVGSGVSEFKVGERVASQTPFGAFAQEVVAPAAFTVKLADATSFEEAAACGTILATAVAAVSIRAKLQPGEWVLVTGAAGGVGSAVVQYARAQGGKVVALVSSEAKGRAATALGAHVVVRSDLLGDLKSGLKAALASQGVDGVEIAIDVVGGETFEACLRCLKPGGRLIVVGFASGDIPKIAVNYLLLKDLSVIGSSLDRLFRERHAEFRQRLAEAFAMLADGRIKAPIEARLPFEDFATAAGRIAGREAVGKIVLLPRLTGKA